MTQFLKQSTAATLVLGPFVDSTDGVTAETALTISQADVRLSKNAGAFAQKGDTNSATHMENGYYSCALNTTDTGTLGRLRVAVNESGALPVWQDFMVVPANVYDSLVGGSDNLQVDTIQLSGTTQTARDIGASVVAASVTGNVGGNVVGSVASVTADVGITQTGADKVWSTTTRLLTAGTNIVLAKGTGVTGFNDLSAAQVNAEVDSALDTAIPGTPTANSINERIKTMDDAYTATRAGNLDNLDATVSSRSTYAGGAVASVTGNVGGNVVGSVGSVTGAVGSVTGAVGSVTGNVGGNVTGSVGSVGTGGISANSFAVGAMDAAALATDFVNEIADGLLDRNMATGTDSGSATTRTPRQALRLLRNKAGIASGTLTVTKEDDSTASWTAAVTTAAGDPISEIDPASA